MSERRHYKSAVRGANPSLRILLSGGYTANQIHLQAIPPRLTSYAEFQAAQPYDQASWHHVFRSCNNLSPVSPSALPFVESTPAQRCAQPSSFSSLSLHLFLLSMPLPQTPISRRGLIPHAPALIIDVASAIPADVAAANHSFVMVFVVNVGLEMEDIQA